MANFCENCGSPLQGSNKFCPNCGAPVKQTEPAVPEAPSALNPPPAETAMDAPPVNTPAGNPSTTSAVPDTSSAVTGAAGAAAAATLGAIHPDPVPAKPQDSFTPPREQIRPDSQPLMSRSLTVGSSFIIFPKWKKKTENAIFQAAFIWKSR